MSIREAIVNRFELANIVAAFVVVTGLLMAFEMKDKTIIGAIIGGGSVWLWKNKRNNEEPKTP